MVGPNERQLKELAIGEDWNINGLAIMTGRAKELKRNLDSLVSSLDGKWEGEAATAGIAALREQADQLEDFAQVSDRTLREVTGFSTVSWSGGGGANAVRTERAESLLAGLPPGHLPWWMVSTVISGTPVVYQGVEVTAENGALTSLTNAARREREERAGVALNQMGAVIGGLAATVRDRTAEYGALLEASRARGADEVRSGGTEMSPTGLAQNGWSGDLPGSGFGGSSPGGSQGWAGGASAGIGAGVGAGVGAGFGSGPGVRPGSPGGPGPGGGFRPGPGSGNSSYLPSGTGPSGNIRDGDFSTLPGRVAHNDVPGGGAGGGRYPGDSAEYWGTTGVDSDSRGVTSLPGSGILAGGGAGAALAAGSAGLKGGSGSGNGALGALFGRTGGAGAGPLPGGVGGLGGGGVAGAGGTGGAGAAGGATGTASSLGMGRGGLAGGLGPAPGSGSAGTTGAGAGSTGGARPGGMMAGAMGGSSSNSRNQRHGRGLRAPRLEDTPEGGPASNVSRAGRRVEEGGPPPDERDDLGHQ